MKKFTAAFLALAMLCIFTSCGGNIKKVKINEVSSNIYSEKDIENAIDTTLKYFKKNFKGCTLTEIGYIGDELSDEFAEWQKHYQKDEVIILISSFDVDSSGDNGSLNPDSTYKRWKWILARDKGKNWVHMDHGY